MSERATALAEGLWDAPKALLISEAQRAAGGNMLVLTSASSDERRLYHDFAHFTGTEVLEFPAWETLPSESIAPSPDVVGERYEVLKKIRTGGSYIILASLQAVLQKLIDPDEFEILNRTVTLGESIAFQALLDDLELMGYQRCPVAADKGEYAVRGGIVDVFPVGLPDAFRIEFWGDEVESIRVYDPIGQKSVRPAEEVHITPAQELEMLGEGKELATILDYLGDNTVIAYDNLVALEDRYATLQSMLDRPLRTLATFEQFFAQSKALQHLYFSECPAEDLCELQLLDGPGSNVYSQSKPTHRIGLDMFSQKLEAHRWMHPFRPIDDFLLGPSDKERTGDDILLALHGVPKGTVALDILYPEDGDKAAFEKQITDLEIGMPSSTTWTKGYLSSGFALDQADKYILLPYTEITHRYRMRRPKMRSTYHTSPAEVYDLSPGEHVVHLNNGIGKFRGVEKRVDHNKVENEFYLIEYADDARLFVPINQSHMISKYVGGKDTKPKMHKLGSKRWQKTRESTEKAIMGYASELLHTYAERSVRGGFQYPADTDDMNTFEDEFPYIETEDQVAAIADVKGDMLSENSMDRLVCGDVGYGKTEVAMRAAFKAVNDGGKQVAVLVPTTVLAMQHYDNFRARMGHFPINIEVLSRARTSKQAKQTIEDLAFGKVDIIIGTHRLVSKDVVFKNLGLVVIDEEQRFGVKAKEHLKTIKAGVDCLTLSATPIPRTLYMSLMGARDMSTIATPPQDRLPISTVIAEPNDQLIKNAILRELNRDGQVYYVHNRVETIYDHVTKIKKLVPHARIVVAHGQMKPEELDSVFHAFREGTADILVATSIIESGVDIPNANTMIVDRADIFGLADLYQLRGRVGRWKRKAYAYLLVPKHRARDEIVAKRLGALADVSGGYGGGMKVAMHDLEIRGAGNILGTEQSGQVSAVGFHLYCKMLKRTIAALQGKLPQGIADTKIEFPVDARLPEDYINEQVLRMELYQRLGEALSWDEVDALWREMKDRFGKPPEPAKWLYHMTRIRVFSSLKGITTLRLNKVTLTIERREEKYTVLIKPGHSPADLEASIITAIKKALKIK